MPTIPEPEPAARRVIAAQKDAAGGIVGLDAQKRVSLQTPSIDLTGGIFGGSVITINPLDGEDESEPFIIGTYSTPFWNDVRDHIMVIGCTAPGRIFDQWEQLYQATADSRLVERHIIYTVAVTAGNRTVGDQVRLDSYTYSYATNFCDYYQTISQYSIKDLGHPTLDTFFAVNNQGNLTLDSTSAGIPKQGLAINCNSEGTILFGVTGAANALGFSALVTSIQTAALSVAPAGTTPNNAGGYWNLYLKKPTGGVQIESTQFGNGYTVLADMGTSGTVFSNGRAPNTGERFGQAASDASKAVSLSVGGTSDMFAVGNYPGDVFAKRLSVNSSGNTVIGKGLIPASMADADAANGTMYYSTTAGKLVFKDASGVVNELYADAVFPPPTSQIITTMPPEALRNDFTGSLGYRFTCNRNIVVTHLGRAVKSPFAQNHAVKLWTDAGVLLASVEVTPDSEQSGSWRYEGLTPVTLTSGSVYRIAVTEYLGGDNWNDGQPMAGLYDTGAITINNSCYGAANSFPDTLVLAGGAYAVPNIYE